MEADGFGDEFGRRDGPCTIEYRDFTWNHHPTYIQFSCLGCAHLEVSEEFGSKYCAHPSFLQAYGCRQYNGGNHQHRDKVFTLHSFCPALRLRGVMDWPIQPQAMPVDRGPSYRVRDEDRDEPFKAIPVHAKSAFLFRSSIQEGGVS